MEIIETCESTLKSGTMEQFPFKYPKIFTNILLLCGTRDIHTIRYSSKSKFFNVYLVCQNCQQCQQYQLQKLGYNLRAFFLTCSMFTWLRVPCAKCPFTNVHWLWLPPCFRCVCSSWRQWVTVSTTLWRKILQQVQVKICSVKYHQSHISGSLLPSLSCKMSLKIKCKQKMHTNMMPRL